MLLVSSKQSKQHKLTSKQHQSLGHWAILAYLMEMVLVRNYPRNDLSLARELYCYSWGFAIEKYGLKS